MSKALEAIIAEYVLHISDETEKLRYTIIAKPEAVCAWIEFNLDHGNWKDCISSDEECNGSNPDFSSIDFAKVITELKSLLDIQIEQCT